MKNYLAILVTVVSIFTSPASYALHQFISNTNTIQYCGGFCTSIDSLEEGSIFLFTGNLNIDNNGNFPDDLLTTLADFTIEISGSSASSLLTLSNTTLVSSNILTSTDEFEQTTILGGLAIFDTSLAFPAFSGVPSELIYNFDNNSIDFFILDNLTASTTAVPIPNALLLFFSGFIGLLSFSKARLKA